MNIEYFNIDQNTGVVTDEKNRINIVNVNDNLNSELEQILNMENDLEESVNHLNNVKNCLEYTIQKKKWKKYFAITSIFTYLLGIIIVGGGPDIIYGLLAAFVTNLSFYLMFNYTLGSRKKINSEINSCNIDITKLNSEISELENKLSKLKKQYDYKRYSLSEYNNSEIKNKNIDIDIISDNPIIINKGENFVYKKKVLKKEQEFIF